MKKLIPIKPYVDSLGLAISVFDCKMQIKHNKLNEIIQILRFNLPSQPR